MTATYPTTLNRLDCSYPYGECRKEWATNLDGDLIYRTYKDYAMSPWLLADRGAVLRDHPELDLAALPRIDDTLDDNA